MQKTRLLVIAVLATALLGTTALSVVAAQETTPPASPDPSNAPEPSVNSETVDAENQTQTSPRDPNATSPDTPIDIGDPILYAAQDNDTDGMAPGAADANLLATQAAPDYTLLYVAIGIVLAVVFGGVIGTVYYRKQAAKTQS